MSEGSKPYPDNIRKYPETCNSTDALLTETDHPWTDAGGHDGAVKLDAAAPESLRRKNNRMRDSHSNHVYKGQPRL